MVYGTYNELVTGVYKPTNITGGPHIVMVCTTLSSISRSMFHSKPYSYWGILNHSAALRLHR